MAEITPPPRERKLGVTFGGSGLIGGTIVNYFKQRRPGLVTMFAPSSKKVSLSSCADIRSYLLSVKPDFIVNAAIANIDAGTQLSFEVNYSGAVNVARAAAALQVPYIFFSSAAALPQGENLREEDRLPLSAKLSNYAKSKLMAENTLEYMATHEGLDYTCIRLSIVYGNHDHKIQGFHRLLFSIADRSMPVLFTRRGAKHSYSNSKKIGYLVHHMLDHRAEFGNKTYHFVDKDPVLLDDLILTIKSNLQLKVPRRIYMPYPMAKTGIRSLRLLLRLLTMIGLKATLPPELMFLGAFYRTQTLSGQKLADSSYVDPFPNETVYTRLPEMISYYLTRWSQQNLITTYDHKLDFDSQIRHDFQHDPQTLIDSIHRDATAPFKDSGSLYTADHSKDVAN